MLSLHHLRLAHNSLAPAIQAALGRDQFSTDVIVVSLHFLVQLLLCLKVLTLVYLPEVVLHPRLQLLDDLRVVRLDDALLEDNAEVLVVGPGLSHQHILCFHALLMFWRYTFKTLYIRHCRGRRPDVNRWRCG